MRRGDGLLSLHLLAYGLQGLKNREKRRTLDRILGNDHSAAIAAALIEDKYGAEPVGDIESLINLILDRAEEILSFLDGLIPILEKIIALFTTT